MFDHGGEGFCLFVGNPGIILIQILQDKVGDILYLVFPLLSSTYIINLPWFEIIHYISKGAAGIFDYIKDTLVTQVNSI